MLARLRPHKELDYRGKLVFKRIQRFYQTFNIISTLLGGLSLAVLTFEDFSAGAAELPTHILDVSAGFMTSSVMTAVVAVMLATILLFRFEGHDKPTRLDLGVSWIPLILVDLVILEFLIGLMTWYAAKYKRGAVIAMTSQLVILLVCTVVIAIWVWNSMSERGGLGEEERTMSGQLRRVADAESKYGSYDSMKPMATCEPNAPSTNSVSPVNLQPSQRGKTWAAG